MVREVRVATAAERGREVRERLLHAAAELIAERGWSAVSTRVLAERAGVAPGVVHYHFASVPALLAEAAVTVMRGLIDEIGGALDAAADPGAVLALLLGALDGYDGNDPTSLLFAEAYLAAGRDEALRRELGAVIDDFRARLAARLGAAGVAAPEATAAVLAAAIDGVMLHRALAPGLTADAVAPVLDRLVVPARTARPQGGRTS
jgi:AcrR family transcriptional regulator